jgi:putative transposase
MAEMEDSFMVAKATLGRATLLGPLDPSAQWTLHVNALTYHIGEVFHQCPKGQSLRQPLCFFFRKLEASQAEWSVFERELYACVESIRHFRFILKGRSFTIFTDHKPLEGALARVSNP